MTSGDTLPEPVRRYLAHAVPSGEASAPGVRLTMSAWIRVGIWLPFVAPARRESFLWRASVGLGPLRPLVVTPAYASGERRHERRAAGSLDAVQANGCKRRSFGFGSRRS